MGVWTSATTKCHLKARLRDRFRLSSPGCRMLRSASRWSRTVHSRFCLRVRVFCCADTHLCWRRCQQDRRSSCSLLSIMCGGTLGSRRLPRLRTAGPVSLVPGGREDTSSRVLGKVLGTTRVVVVSSRFVDGEGGCCRGSTHFFAPAVESFVHSGRWNRWSMVQLPHFVPAAWWRLLIGIRAGNSPNLTCLHCFPQGGLASASLWRLTNPHSRSQGGQASGQASRLRESSIYSAGKVAGSVRRLSTVTLSLRGLG